MKEETRIQTPMPAAELAEALRLHALWVAGDPEGRKAVLHSAGLSGADLRGACLRNASLTRADLSGADLTGADLLEAFLWGANLRGADLRHATLPDACLHQANLQGADLREADLTGAEARLADLTGADLSEASLRNADLQATLLRDARLKEACLRGADLRVAVMAGADLGGADLRHACLRGVDLSGADLTGADLTGADTAGTRFSYAIYVRRVGQDGRRLNSHETFATEEAAERRLAEYLASDVERLDDASLLVSDYYEFREPGEEEVVAWLREVGFDSPEAYEEERGEPYRPEADLGAPWWTAPERLDSYTHDVWAWSVGRNPA